MDGGEGKWLLNDWEMAEVQLAVLG